MYDTWTADTAMRLDAFLSSCLPEVSRKHLQDLIKEGVVEINSAACKKPSTTVKSGDSVTLLADPFEVVETAALTPTDIALDVIYEDDDCLIINKPAGYSVHPGIGMSADEVTILHGIAYLFQEQSLPFAESCVLVHRLDKDTTGCLLIAKTPAAHHALQQQFQARSVEKSYLAIVGGEPSPSQAKIDAPIGRNVHDRTKMSVMQTAKSREAITIYKTLDSTGEVSLLECDLHTGRTHQIRVHLDSIGHSLLGDTTYYSKESLALSAKYDVSTICLHAQKLCFKSPSTQQSITVTASAPKSFTAAAKSTGLVLST